MLLRILDRVVVSDGTLLGYKCITDRDNIIFISKYEIDYYISDGIIKDTRLVYGNEESNGVKDIGGIIDRYISSHKDIMDIQKISNNRVKLLDVKDKVSSGRLVLPSFITDYNTPLKGCKFSEVIINNSKDIDIDISSLCAMMDSKRLKLVVKNPEYVTSMYGLCYNSLSLEELDISGLNLKNVIDIGYLVGGCKRLKVIDMRGTDVSRVENMVGMFSGCEELSISNIRGVDSRVISEYRRTGIKGVV